MKTLFTILFLYICFDAFAQKIHFTDTSNVWKEVQPQYNFPGPTLYSYHTYNFVSDSTIGLHNYKQFNFFYNYACRCTSSFVREDTALNKVYIWNNVADSEVVLMDYNLRVGDTFKTQYNRFAVVKIDSTLINGVWHKVWCFRPLTIAINGDTFRVIEGIGCIQHPTYMLWDFSGCVECMQPFMYCFSNNGITPPLSPPISFLDNSTSCTYYPMLNEKAIPNRQSKIATYPNPATDKLTVTSSDYLTSITVINLLGQLVIDYPCNSEKETLDISNLPRGSYIIKINSVIQRLIQKN